MFDNRKLDTNQPSNLDEYNISELLLIGTGGLLSSISELILCWIAFSAEVMAEGRTPGGIYRAMRNSSDAVYGREFIKKLDYDSTYNALYYLKNKGLLAMTKDKLKSNAITQAGKQRLAQNFPAYLINRPWDGKVYLITYDIPETQRQKRDLLREFIKRLGCAILQRSVWVSVYDPRQMLHDWNREHQVEGSLIVSDVGRDGSIAGQTIPELAGRVYRLDEIDSLYRSFIFKYEDYHKPSQVNQWELMLDWATCLERDPQIPFELLPSWFSDKKANKLCKKLMLPQIREIFQPSKIDRKSPWHHFEKKHLRRLRLEKKGLTNATEEMQNLIVTD